MKSSTRDKIAGTARNIAGQIKEVTGKALGNNRLTAEGKADKVEGRVGKKIGQIKQVFGK
jgi:uncharacterized protein YjbJ (UPF0337 family)